MYLCEFLPRLNTITVQSDFEGETASITNLRLTQNESSTRLVVSTQSNDTLIQLPISVTSPQIKSINCSNGILSVSISVATAGPAKELSFMDLVDSSLQKWSVRDLLMKTPKNANNINTFAFACAQCHATIIDSTLAKFSDLPSELWHEMMEFWHCHKPHTNNHHEKHYDGPLQPRENDVLVGNTYLLVSQDNKTTSDAARVENNKVVCSKCSFSLGEASLLLKLYKWNLHLCYGDKTEAYDSSSAVYYTLVEKINSMALRKFVLKSKSENPLVIWVINVGMHVSTSTKAIPNCLKVLYSEGGLAESENGAEIVDVLPEVMTSFRKCLETTNKELPELARTVKIKDGDSTVERHVSYLSG